MNLWFRLIWTVLRALRGPRVRPGDTVELELRVWPNDLDLNGHMNNGRYLTIVDLALTTVFIRSGFARLCMQRDWRPMGGGTVVYFRRGLTVFERFTLRFSIVAWDEFWTYSRFEFVRAGEMCATGFAKGAAVGRRGLVPNRDVYPVLGHEEPSPPFPEDLKAWIEADRLLHTRVKSAAG